MNIDQLSHHLLIATPSLTDPLFANSVVYIDSHNNSGAQGLIINKPLATPLTKVLKHLNITTTHKGLQTTPVFEGGPVSLNQGTVIYLEKSEDSDDSPNIVTSTNKQLLQDISDQVGPEHYMIMLGYSTWDSGQLEAEIAHNDWLIAPCDNNILFHTPVQQRRQRAAQLLGIDLTHLSRISGRA